MRIAVAADHAGFELKEQLLAVVREAGILKADVKYEEIIDMSFVESVRASL